MRFYNMDASIVASVLERDCVSSTRANKLPFPFRVSPTEQWIIRFGGGGNFGGGGGGGSGGGGGDGGGSGGLEPLLLLGRSGTGKTTCCLHRMFISFMSHWGRQHSMVASEGGLASGHCPADGVESASSYRYMAGVTEAAHQQQATRGAGGHDKSSGGGSKKLNGKAAGAAARHESASAAISPTGADPVDGPAPMRPLHQLFVTRNPVLRAEVRRSFHDLIMSSGRVAMPRKDDATGDATGSAAERRRRGSKATSGPHSDMDTDLVMRYPFPVPAAGFSKTPTVPSSFKADAEIDPHEWPMFLSSVDLYRVIDETLPPLDGKRCYYSHSSIDSAVASTSGARTGAGAISGANSSARRNDSEFGTLDTLDEATVVTAAPPAAAGPLSSRMTSLTSGQDKVAAAGPRGAPPGKKGKGAAVVAAAAPVRVLSAGRELMTFEVFNNKYWLVSV